MTDYSPPIEDIEFLLNEVLHLSEICDLPGYEDVSSDLVSSVLIEAGKFASEILAPLNKVGDIEGARLENGVVITPAGWKGAYRRFVDAGWGSLLLDKRYGGQGLPRLVGAAVQEMWDGANMAFGLCPMLTQTAAQLIAFRGSIEQKNTYLEHLISGEWSGTMNLTEPHAGSDLSAVRTRAVKTQDEHYLLTGQKIFITYGDHDLTKNIVHLVLARTPNSPSGVKGISLFIVPKFIPDSVGEPGDRNDIRTVSIEHKLGIHGSPTAILSYGDHGGATGFLLGEEHHGLEYMFVMMNKARHAVGIEAYAIAERSYQSALAYAKQRIQGWGLVDPKDQRIPIVQHPDVARMLLEMRCRIEAMRALSLYVAAEQDRADRNPEQSIQALHQKIVDVLTPIVKGWSSEIGNLVTGQALQVFGGMGFIEETGAAQHYRDARITTIYEGTSGIQAADLVRRKLLSDGGVVINDIIQKIKTDIAESSIGGLYQSEIDEIVNRMSDAVVELEKSTEWILESAARDPRLPLAASFHYLMLWGVVAGGWQMERAARVASCQFGKELGMEFYREKLLTVRCYVRYVLPICGSHAAAIQMGSELVNEFDRPLT